MGDLHNLTCGGTMTDDNYEFDERVAILMDNNPDMTEQFAKIIATEEIRKREGGK